MAQIRNKFDINNSISEENSRLLRKLPNFSNTQDEIPFWMGILFSLITHVVFVIFMIILSAFMGLVFPHLPKPELPTRDVEFKLVQNESKPPINKNTKIRSDRDSRAGGKHDPKRAVSEPTSKSSKPVKQAQKPSPSKQQKPAKAQPKKTVASQKTVVQKPQPVSKPAPIKAPSVANKPAPQANPTAKPSAPKTVVTPKSPFVVPVTPSSAPVGTTYKPSSSGSANSGGSSGIAQAPAPKFSTSGSSSSGSAGSMGNSKYSARGSSGYGSSGNPSPGNPNGTPGIDAIRQPNWGPYMRDLEQRIKRNWSPPKGDTSKRVVITFTIGRDGRLLSRTITKSSGVPLADQAAMSAIESTAPFRPLPPEFRGTSVPIEFTFDYNVLNSTLR